MVLGEKQAQEYYQKLQGMSKEQQAAAFQEAMKNPDFNKYKGMIEKATGMKADVNNTGNTGNGTVPVKKFRF